MPLGDGEGRLPSGTTIALGWFCLRQNRARARRRIPVDGYSHGPAQSALPSCRGDGARRVDHAHRGTGQGRHRDSCRGQFRIPAGIALGPGRRRRPLDLYGRSTHRDVRNPWVARRSVRLRDRGPGRVVPGDLRSTRHLSLLLSDPRGTDDRHDRRYRGSRAHPEADAITDSATHDTTDRHTDGRADRNAHGRPERGLRDAACNPGCRDDSPGGVTAADIVAGIVGWSFAGTDDRRLRFAGADRRAR